MPGPCDDYDDDLDRAGVVSGCSCSTHGVTGLHDLLALLALGIDQWVASRIVWSPFGPQKNPAQDAADAAPQAGSDVTPET